MLNTQIIKVSSDRRYKSILAFYDQGCEIRRNHDFEKAKKLQNRFFIQQHNTQELTSLLAYYNTFCTYINYEINKLSLCLLYSYC